MWWRNATIYEIYVRSFADSNRDGVGDLIGVVDRLDYLEWLGIDAVWLTPIMSSPGRDHGYDVSDYLSVDSRLGTLADLDRLVLEAGQCGIKVLLDLVPNHTSDRHPWFRDPRKRGEYYVWADRPNNWMSTFHIPSWSYDEHVGRYYLHSYLPEQPDLNWWSERVRAEFDRVLAFWFDRGIAGFRIDACYIIVKDRLLRDNPPIAPGDHLWDRNRGQRPVWNAHRPEVHDILRRWRALARQYDSERLLLGATWVPAVSDLVAYYGDDDELQLPQYFQFMFADFTVRALLPVVEQWLDLVPVGQVPVWAASSHDLSRFPSRWCEGNDELVRTALTLLLTLPGACVLYQGDELGLQDTILRPDCRQDRASPPRDAYRTPMPWDGTDYGGFSEVTPWLPLGDLSTCNVRAQRRDPGSALHHTRRLIAQKKRLTGPYRRLEVTDNSWTYMRGETLVRLDSWDRSPS